jgi:hypothetical protein
VTNTGARYSAKTVLNCFFFFFLLLLVLLLNHDHDSVTDSLVHGPQLIIIVESSTHLTMNDESSWQQAVLSAPASARPVQIGNLTASHEPATEGSDTWQMT